MPRAWPGRAARVSFAGGRSRDPCRFPELLPPCALRLEQRQDRRLLAREAANRPAAAEARSQRAIRIGLEHRGMGVARATHARGVSQMLRYGLDGLDE